MVCSTCCDFISRIDSLKVNISLLEEDASHITNSSLLDTIESEIESFKEEIEFLNSEIESCGCSRDGSFVEIEDYEIPFS